HAMSQTANPFGPKVGEPLRYGHQFVGSEAYERGVNRQGFCLAHGEPPLYQRKGGLCIQLDFSEGVFASFDRTQLVGKGLATTDRQFDFEPHVPPLELYRHFIDYTDLNRKSIPIFYMDINGVIIPVAQ